MNQKNILNVLSVVIAAVVVSYFVYVNGHLGDKPKEDLDPTPTAVTLSGQYVCLPHLGDISTEECAFGLKTDAGEYYAVNFGQMADGMTAFMSGSRVTAEGFVVIKEALSSNQWANYNMKGIFTFTKILETTASQGKLNIDVVCNQALAYMTFPDGKASDEFLVSCKKGDRPEVIEEYKKRMNLGDGASI